MDNQRRKENEYKILKREHQGPLVDPCTEYSANQAIDLCNIKEGDRILDYGCSIGRASQIFLNHGCDVYCVDVVPENLQKATIHCTDTFLRETQSTPMPWKSDIFDLVFSSQVIEHLHRRDGVAFLEESFDLLKDGGKIFLTTPNPHYLRVLLMRSPMIRGCHLSSWIIEELNNALEEIGFKNIFWKGNGRMATLIGPSIPCRYIYGGYAIIGEK